MFPSHIGSRSTRDGIGRILRNYLVSIPHWFSLNHIRKQKRMTFLFPSHIGSRSTRPSVLTLRPLGGFHPTLVLAQLIIFTFCYSYTVRFHPTLVLAQQLVEEVGRDSEDMFPSHIGSRSTEIDDWTARKLLTSFHPTLVLAQPARNTTTMPGKSFHPTLVLAQRRTAGVLCFAAICFHPTLVLAQPRGDG